VPQGPINTTCFDANNKIVPCGCADYYGNNVTCPAKNSCIDYNNKSVSCPTSCTDYYGNAAPCEVGCTNALGNPAFCPFEPILSWKEFCNQYGACFNSSDSIWS